MIPSVADDISTILAEHMPPPERVTVDEWADRYRKVRKPTPWPGQWQTSRVEYMREPMRDFTDPNVREIVCMQSPQTGKTEFIINCLFYAICEWGDDIMFVLDNQETMRDFSKSRLQPQLEECPKTAALLTDSAHDKNIMSIHFRNGCNLWMTGANSAGKLSNKPVRVVGKDEIDKWSQELRGRGRVEAAAEQLADARADSYGDLAKLLSTSTPTEEKTGIHAAFMRSDMAERYVPCPHCGKWQRLVFKGVAWEGGGGGDLDDAELAQHAELVRLNSWYVCQHEGCVIQEHDRQPMLNRGRWVREGESLSPDGVLSGERIKTRVRGYHIGWLDVPLKRWGDIAYEWVRARGEMNRDFCNRVLAEPWRVQGAKVSDKRLHQLIDSQHQRALAMGVKVHDRGRIPQTACLLVGGVDVQKDKAYWSVRALLPKRVFALVDWGEVPWPTVPDGQTLGESETHTHMMGLLRRRWEVHGRDGDEQSVDWWAIDSGHRTMEVLRLCALAGGKLGGVIPVKGMDTLSQPIQYQKALDELPANRKTAAARLRSAAAIPVMQLNVLHWKDVVFESMHRDGLDTSMGDMELPGPGGMLWPSVVDPGYIRQITSEHRAPIVRNGATVGYRWSLRPGQIHNHWFDCEVYATALMSVVTGGFQHDQYARMEAAERVKLLGT